MDLFNPENLKHLQPGDVIVLSIVAFLVFMFFKYRAPAIAHKLELKVDTKDCMITREGCQNALFEKLDGMEKRFISQIEDLKDQVKGMENRMNIYFNGKH